MATVRIGHSSGRCTNKRRRRGTRGTDLIGQFVAGNTFRCCPGCAHRDSWSVREYIEQGLQAVADGTWVWFLTITEPSEFRSVQAHAESVSAFLEQLWAWIGPKPYCWVREFQKRGAVHTHCLVVGAPRVEIQSLQLLARLHGLGAISLRGTFQSGSGVYKVDGQYRKITSPSAYLSKTFGRYLSKSANDWRHYCDLMPKGYRQLGHGGGWPSTLGAVRDARRARSPRAQRRLTWQNAVLTTWHATDLLVSMLGATHIDPFTGIPCGTRVSTVDSDLGSGGNHDPCLVT